MAYRRRYNASQGRRASRYQGNGQAAHRPLSERYERYYAVTLHTHTTHICSRGTNFTDFVTRQCAQLRQRDDAADGVGCVDERAPQRFPPASVPLSFARAAAAAAGIVAC